MAEEVQKTANEVTSDKKVKITIPLKGIRKIMAQRTLRSLQVSAQLTVSGAIDMTEMMRLRGALLSQEKMTSIHFTYTDLFVKIVAQALRKNPLLNSSLVGEEITVWESINIGVALAIDLKDGGSGLVVVVVKDADKKSLTEIHDTLNTLLEKGRNQQLNANDVNGGTFTISNVGVTGIGGGVRSTSSTPIINQPEVAIITTYPITDTPVVRDGQIVVRPMMNYSLTYDHRVLTGEDATRFRGSLQQLMEQPYLMLM